MPDLRLAQGRLEIQDLSTGNILRIEYIYPETGRFLAKPGLQQRRELPSVLLTGVPLLEARIRLELGNRQHVTDGLPLLLLVGGDVDVPVLRAEGATGGRREVVVPHESRLLSTDEQIGRHPPHERHDAVQQGHVDELALARALSVEEGRHHGEGRVQATHRVTDREAGPERIQSLVAIHRHLARQPLDDLVVGGLQGVGPRLTEARDGAVDQLGIELRQRRVAQAQAVHDAGAEVLHHHVGVLHQAAEERLALGGLGVQRDGSLVAVLGEETRAHELLVQFREDPEFAGQVPVLGVLHLDDIRAQQGQVQRGEGPRQHIREIQDLDALEDLPAHAFPFAVMGPVL